MNFQVNAIYGKLIKVGTALNNYSYNDWIYLYHQEKLGEVVSHVQNCLFLDFAYLWSEDGNKQKKKQQKMVSESQDSWIVPVIKLILCK